MDRERKQREIVCVVWRAFVAHPLCVSNHLFLLWIRCLMVQFCWIWLVPVVMQSVWTTTRRLVWKIPGGLRGRMVLPGVQHWKLMESYEMQTLCEGHERDCGIAANLNPSEEYSLGKDAGLQWATSSLYFWKESSGERIRTTFEDAQRPEEHGVAHRGEAELDQHGVQTRRCRERESCGDA